MRQKLNFTYTMVASPDDFYGVHHSDGNWSGLVGMIYNDQADICINDMTITTERSKVGLGSKEQYRSLVKHAVGSLLYWVYTLRIQSNLKYTKLLVTALRSYRGQWQQIRGLAGTM